MGNYLSRRSAEERLEARVAYLEAENASLRRAASRGDLRDPRHRPRLPSWDWEFRIPSDVLILCLSRVPFDDLGSVRACCGRWHRIAREASFALERRRSGFAESRLVVGFNVATCGEDCGDAGDAPAPDRWWALTLARGGAGAVVRAEPLPPAPRRARAASHALVADPPVPGVALFGGEGAVGEANVPLRLDVARRRWTALAETAVDHLAYRAAGSVRRVEFESSTRLQCAHMRQFRRELFYRASRTRREHSIRPKISRIDFDVTELENSQVWWG